MTYNIASTSYSLGVAGLPRLKFKRGAITVREIQRKVADHFGIGAREMTCPHRGSNHVCTARQIAMLLAHEFTQHSSVAIGREFGGRDHTTVLHAFRAAKEKALTKGAVFEALTHLRQVVAGTVDSADKADFLCGWAQPTSKEQAKNIQDRMAA